MACVSKGIPLEMTPAPILAIQLDLLGQRGRRIVAGSDPLGESRAEPPRPRRADEVLMLIASQLRPGIVLKIGPDIFKVFESTYHIGQGKMPGAFTPARTMSLRARSKSSVSGRKNDWRKPNLKSTKWNSFMRTRIPPLS